MGATRRFSNTELAAIIDSLTVSKLGVKPLKSYLVLKESYYYGLQVEYDKT